MFNWKVYSLPTLFFFGSVIGIASLAISFVHPKPIDTCHSNLQIINAVYGIIGTITTMTAIWVMLRMSRPEMEFFHTYILGTFHTSF
jgi:hypothetical protein